MDELIEAAKDVRTRAYAPYSNFKVGAALRAASGRVFTGCNVENAAYPEGTCAEAGAIAAMVAAGETQLIEVAVVTDSAAPSSPCGGCRQKLREFGGPDVAVHMATLSGAAQTQRLDTLLPGAFDAKQMEAQ